MARVCRPQPQPPYPHPGFSLHCFKAVPGSITAYLHARLETLRRNTSPPQGKAGPTRASDSQPVPSSQDMLGSCGGHLCERLIPTTGALGSSASQPFKDPATASSQTQEG